MEDLSQEFLDYYRNKFKPVALKCAEGYKTILRAERKEIPEDSPELDFLTKMVDAQALWEIGLLIGDIERAMFNHGRLNLVNQICKVSGCLNSESYWTNVWKNDYTSEEAKNLRELAPIVKELMQKM